MFAGVYTFFVVNSEICVILLLYSYNYIRCYYSCLSDNSIEA